MSTATTGGAYICDWCAVGSSGLDLSCPGCGAPVDVERRVTPSGWREAPGIRDMARLTMGGSTCQIEGLYVPVADFNLAAPSPSPPCPWPAAGAASLRGCPW
jgi:hypothetical protein